MFNYIQKMCLNQILNSGYNILKNNEEIYLFQEFCCDKKLCPFNEKDRYGLSCNILNDNNELVFKTRFSDFPW